jgi:hypothetical protein
VIQQRSAAAIRKGDDSLHARCNASCQPDYALCLQDQRGHNEITVRKSTTISP